MSKGPMKGLKGFLLSLGIFLFVGIVIIIIIGFLQDQKQQKERDQLQDMSIEEVRKQATRR